MMHPQKLRSVLSMSAPERYGYFVRKAADTQEVWGLRKPGGLWVVSSGEDGAVVYPFWPEKEFAEAAAINEWADAAAAAIGLDEFLDRWLPGMQASREKVGVFWAPPSMVGIDVAPETLRRELQEECAQYED